MKKFIMTILILNGLIWFGLSSLASNAKAGEDYNTAVIGHIITNHDKIDHAKLLESEMSKVIIVFDFEMDGILEKDLPYIMNNAMNHLRLELDKQNKCFLLKDSKIKDKDCK